MEPQIDSAKKAMQRALRSSGLSESETNTIIFNLTDWIDDLRPFVNLLESPNQYTDDEIHKILIAFLVHAPDHLKIAADTILEAGDNTTS